MKNRNIVNHTIGVMRLLQRAVGQAAALLFFEPLDQTVPTGQQISVDLGIAGLGNGTARSLDAFNLDIDFDTTVLAFNNVTFGDQLDLLGLFSARRNSPVLLPARRTI